MKSMLSLATAACTLALAACTTAGGPGTAAAPAPPPAAAASPAPTPAMQRCQLQQTEMNTCEQRGSSGQWECDLYVYTASPPIVLPYTLVVPRNARKLTVMWHLIDPRAEFDAGKGDGPRGLVNDFENGHPFNTGPSVPSAKGKKYRITYKNDVPNQEHRYAIQFRVGSQPFECDPNIVNSSN